MNLPYFNCIINVDIDKHYTDSNYKLIIHICECIIYIIGDLMIYFYYTFI